MNAAEHEGRLADLAAEAAHISRQIGQHQSASEIMHAASQAPVNIAQLKQRLAEIERARTAEVRRERLRQTAPQRALHAQKIRDEFAALRRFLAEAQSAAARIRSIARAHDALEPEEALSMGVNQNIEAMYRTAIDSLTGNAPALARQFLQPHGPGESSDAKEEEAAALAHAFGYAR